MAVVSFGATIVPFSDTITRRGIAGAAIAAGEVVAIDALSSKYAPADADDANRRNAVGIALNSAAANQPVEIAVSGRLGGLSGLLPGSVYVLANIPGDVASAYAADLTEDVSYVSVVAVALTASTILLCICASGVVMNLA